MSARRLLRRVKPRSFRPAAVRPRPALLVESLEERLLLTSAPGMTLTGSTPPSWNQLYDKVNDPVKSDVGYFVGKYAGPGINPYVNVDNGGNINLQYLVNGSPSFNQPVQTSDW